MAKNSSILKHRGKSYTANDLKEAPIKRTQNEVNIITAREGEPLSDMNDDGLRYVADQIIVNGTSMYGSELPQTEFFASVLSKQIIDYLLKFGYSNLTLEEINLALQINTEPEINNPLGENLQQVRFSGKFIHVSFLAGVLKNYMVLRNNLDRKFQNHIDGY